MRGQGFSSCLICKDDSGLVLASEFVRKITETCFNTDDFEVMLSATKMCFSCIGRIQQLHQFLSHRNAFKDSVLEYPEKSCRFCFVHYKNGNELLDDRTAIDLRILITTTPFAGELLSQQIFKCCYSCANFLAMWNDYKEIMKECLIKFHRTVENCTVLVNRNPATYIKEENMEEEPSVDDVNSDQMTIITDAIPPQELQDSPTSDQNQIDRQELTTEHVEQIKDRENENSSNSKEMSTQRRNKSMKLQDINDNIVVRRPRRETSVPAKFAEFDNSKIIGDKNCRSRIESLPLKKKTTANRRRNVSMHPHTKKSHIESQSRTMTESELISFYHIVPCRVSIEPLPIELPRKARQAPTKQVKKQIRKKGLKVKLTPVKKKSAKSKNSTSSADSKSSPRSAIFAMPIGFKSEPEDRQVVVQETLPGLIISEDLPPTLIISEDFCENLNDNAEKVHAQEQNRTSEFTSENVNMIDHEEVVDAMEVDETDYTQQYTEIEFIRHPHRNRETVELSDCNAKVNPTEALESSIIASK